jgi:hypothetical protein
MLRKLSVITIMAVGVILFLTQIVIPHSSKPKLRADAEARLGRLERGRQIILNACAVAGGLETWRSKRDVSLRLMDEWNLPISIWPAKRVESLHSYLLHRNIGRVEMSTRHGLHQWGLFNGVPWALLNGEIDANGIKRAEFAIRNFAYFFELPFKFLDNGAYPEFVGEETENGKVYEKVYVSFGLNVGFYPTDWYLAYFDKASGYLAAVTYTSVEKSPSLFEYTATFTDYQNFAGLAIPTRVKVDMARPISGITIHQWQVNDVRFDKGLDEAFFEQPGERADKAAWSLKPSRDLSAARQ